ncbi:MAG TPA: hypothetical protein ENK27_06385 [Desulfobulbus sp.]|nr:hypothetical protein [Desulfobulbus sp.]
MSHDRYHIIITGEKGRGRTLVIRKKLARNLFLGTTVFGLLLLAMSIFGIRTFGEYRTLRGRFTTTADQLRQQTARLARTEATLASVRAEKARLVANYEEQVADLREEQSRLEGSINRLDERSRIIQTVMDRIGVKVKVEEDPSHSGGPFIEEKRDYGDSLISSSDRYLELLQKIPLGRPVSTGISSGFGSRIDPINHKRAFHAGIDFKGDTGDKVHATGDAVVKQVGYNKGLGRFIILSHGNGYETVFAHLEKQLVKKGDHVTRGQVIGLMGNTGRSTGSHLHYEVRYHGRAINPMKYIQVAGLNLTVRR